jgi:tyrosine-protein kinase Etk/Wzc
LVAAKSAPDLAEMPDDEIDLGLLAQRLWAGRWRIVAIIFLAGVIGVVVALLRTPIYQADALLQLEEKKGSLALPEGMSDLFSDTPVSVTEIEIIRSRLVLGQAVAELHLDWSVEPRHLPVIGNALLRYDLPVPATDLLAPFVRPRETLRLDFLKVPPQWLDQDIVLTVGETATFTLDLPDETRIEGQTGKRLTDIARDFSLQIGEITAAPGRQFILSQIGEIKAIENLRETLTVAERGRQSGVIELRYASRDPVEAERVLSAVADAYLEQNIARSAAEADSSLEFVQGQVPEAEAAVKKAEGALNAYMLEQQTVDLSLETEGILTQTTALEGEMRELARREDEVKRRYTPNHPIYQQLLDERQRVQDQLDALQGEVETLPTTQQELLNLTRTLELAQEVYVQLLNRSQELRVLRASSIGSVRIIDTARTAPKPIAPKKATIVAISIALGGLLGVGYVILRGWLTKGVRGQDELERLGKPVFATINYAPKAALTRKTRGSQAILALSNPTDLTIEGLRSLRTSLHFGMLDAKTKSLAITSTAPNAGKSFTAVNLATVIAESGQTVCLIDADMRRGTLRRYFNIEKNRPGLAEVLAGQATLDEVIVKGPSKGLNFIPTGRFPPNPSELLMRDSFAKLISDLNERFDMTLVDSPPVLAVTDPVIIGRVVGANIAIVRHLETPIAEVLAMLRILEGSNVPLAGLVLNGFDPTKAKEHGQVSGYRYEYKKSAD